MPENTKKYITFSVPVEKELDNGNTTTYKTKFINSFKFMRSSLSSLADNLTERLHIDKYNGSKSCLKYISTKDNQIMFKSSKGNKNHKNYFNKDLTKDMASTCKFCGGDNKLFLLLTKRIYPYEYIDSWKIFDEALFPD